VAWGKVCRLLELGGLSISSLKELGWVLRMRWLWLEKTYPSRQWLGLPMPVPDKTFSSQWLCKQKLGMEQTHCYGGINGYMDREWPT
jgi:hypothetical protein